MTPAEDDVTSLSAIGGNAHYGQAAFTTTHWSVVLEAQGESPAAQEALEKLCRIYWRPIYSFLRRQGISADDAEDDMHEDTEKPYIIASIGVRLVGSNSAWQLRSLSSPVPSYFIPPRIARVTHLDGVRRRFVGRLEPAEVDALGAVWRRLALPPTA